MASFPQEVNDNKYFSLVHNTSCQHKPLPQPPKQPNKRGIHDVTLPADLSPLLSKMTLNSQLRRLEQHRLYLHFIQQRQQQKRQQRLWLGGERKRQELLRQLERQRRWQEKERQRPYQQKQLERQCQDPLKFRLRQQQEERRRKRQLELEQLKQQQDALHAKLSLPSYGLSTIYEDMQTSENEDGNEMNEVCLENQNLRPNDLDWTFKSDMVQKLIDQALLLKSEDGCPPLLYLQGHGGGILNPLESKLWPHVLHQLSPESATIKSVSSYSPTRGSSPQGDWTIVELETSH